MACVAAFDLHVVQLWWNLACSDIWEIKALPHLHRERCLWLLRLLPFFSSVEGMCGGKITVGHLHGEGEGLFNRNRVLLTGATLSRHTLKFLFWFIFSFFNATRVSPINSLCPNLSSSQTESLWSHKDSYTLKRSDQRPTCLKRTQCVSGQGSASTWGSYAACPRLSGRDRWASRSTLGCGCFSGSLCAACWTVGWSIDQSTGMDI